jgi:hypothetical protein
MPVPPEFINAPPELPPVEAPPLVAPALGAPPELEPPEVAIVTPPLVGAVPPALVPPFVGAVPPLSPRGPSVGPFGAEHASHSTPVARMCNASTKIHVGDPRNRSHKHSQL